MEIPGVSGLALRQDAGTPAIHQRAYPMLRRTRVAEVRRAGDDAGLDGSRCAPHEHGGQQQEQGESELSELQEGSFPGHASFRPKNEVRRGRRNAPGIFISRLLLSKLWPCRTTSSSQNASGPCPTV